MWETFSKIIHVNLSAQCLKSVLTSVYNKLYHVHVLLLFNYLERLKIHGSQKNSIIISQNHTSQINHK